MRCEGRDIALLGNLRPTQPPPLLARWGIDHNQISQRIQLNVVKNATDQIESRLISNVDFTNTLLLII